jgi:hypothetical protein
MVFYSYKIHGKRKMAGERIREEFLITVGEKEWISRVKQKGKVSRLGKIHFCRVCQDAPANGLA